MSNLSKTILELRRERQLTQKQLANLLDVKQHTVSQWEKHGKVPELATVIRLADKLDVPYEVLLTPLIVDIKSKTV